MLNKICHITSVHTRLDIRIFFKEVCSLHSAGFEVTFLVADGLGDAVVNGIKIFDAGKISGNRISRITKNPKLILKAIDNIDCDLYHFHDPELIPVGLKLIKRGKKVIYDTHEDVPRQTLSKDYIPYFLRKLISITFELYENYASKKFSGIVTATPFIKKRFDKINQNCIDINNYPLNDEIEDQQVESQKSDYAIYIGAISEIRGIFPLLDSLSYGNFKLKIAGNFDSELLKDKIENHKNWSKVIYLGQISRQNLSKELSSAAAGIVTFLPEPNHIAAQPNKIFEYMSARIPIVASDFPLWKEIIEDNKCGICVDPTNPESIAEAIIKLLSDTTLANKMGNNGRNAVIEKYNWDNEKIKLINFYMTLLNYN